MDLSHSTALLFSLIAIAASDGALTKREYGLLESIAQNSDIIDINDIDSAINAALILLDAPDDIDNILPLIADNLPSDLYIYCYALCAEFTARNKIGTPEEVRLLDRLAQELKIARLPRAAIDYTMQMRYDV